VEFDFDVVIPPNLTTVRVRSEFPRIQPRNARENLSTTELELLKTKLGVWVDFFFNTKADTKYFEDLIQVISLWSAYANVSVDIDSEHMALTLKTFFWLWHTDDVLELSFEKNIPCHILDKGISQLLQVLRDDDREFVEVEGCPGFRSLFNSLVDLHESFKRYNSGYKDISGPFRFFLRKYFGAMRWYAVERLDGFYSEETFACWRHHVSAFDFFASVIFMLSGHSLPNKLLKSPSLRRILEIFNSVSGSTNDLLGLTKEFKYGQIDNLVVFKVLHRGIPIQEAVAQVCESVKSQLTDFLLLRDSILYEFSHDPDLVQYIDLLETMMDGHNRIYPESNRHLSAGKVTLSR